MITHFMETYAMPIAVTATLAVGGGIIKNTSSIAVLNSKEQTAVEVQRELVHEVKSLTIIVTRMDARLEIKNGDSKSVR